LITPPAAKFASLLAFFTLKTCAAEIHRELCAAVYNQNVMSERTVRQWCTCSIIGEQVFKIERTGRPYIASDDLVHSVDQKICERRRFTTSELSCEFPHISRTVIYEIITVRIGSHMFCARWVPKMLSGEHKTQRVASALTFLERHHKDGDEFLHHIIRVTDDQTWVSFLNAETKENSKNWMHSHSTNKPKILNKRCLPARKLRHLFSATGKECS
jgi:hypothetical protein